MNAKQMFINWSDQQDRRPCPKTAELAHRGLPILIGSCAVLHHLPAFARHRRAPNDVAESRASFMEKREGVYTGT